MAHWGREKSNLIPVLQRVHILIKCQTDTGRTDRRCYKWGDTNSAVCSLINFLLLCCGPPLSSQAGQESTACLCQCYCWWNKGLPSLGNSLQTQKCAVISLAIHRCSKHSCVKPMVLFNPWGCKHNPRYCVLTLDSEKLNDILVKPVANHYRYFWTVENKTGFWLEAALGQANPMQGTAEKLPLSKLALKEYLKCSLSRFFWCWLLPSRLQSSAAAWF